MEETKLKKEALSLSQKNMLDYFQTRDVKYVHEDAVYKNLSTGETYRGKAEIGAMLHYMHHVAFEAKVQVTSYIITEDKAQFEGFFKGKHIGEFAGLPATNKEVNVPLCVTYDLKDGLIKEARIFFLTDTLTQQLGMSAGIPGQKTNFLVRDIFQLKFGHFRDVKKLLDEAVEGHMMPPTKQMRALTDFTGDAYRLIFEEGFDDLGEYETSLSSSMKAEQWQQWYERFKPHVERSYREILRQIK